MKKSPSETAKLDRKTIERNRRIHMKDLCFKLASLVPHHHSKHYSKEMLTQQDQIDLAASYISQLRERIEKLKAKKEQATKSLNGSTDMSGSEVLDDHQRMRIGARLPVIELKDLGCSIEVILISGLQKSFMLYEVISVLEEEGAEVVSASFSTVDDKVFYTLHAQVKLSRVGVETSRVWERLQDLVY
ncbi:hypothetical protein L484_014999 [Morus notabilis]|uniref:BHLH domain-containing protein n=2 Tax=Morus notabilis TaxID=981085 RepID=W9RMU0_9ROSA|nr:hypothetical protein L484_014999 [Morus notabilis]